MNFEKYAAIHTDVKAKSKKLKESMKCVYKLGNASKLCDNQPGYEAIFHIYTLLQDEIFLENNHRWHQILSYDFDKMLVDMWFYLCEQCDDFDFKKLAQNQSDDTLPETNTNLNQRKISIFKYLIEITYAITRQVENHHFYELSRRLFSLNIIKALLNVYKRKKFLNKSSDKFDAHVIIIAVTGILRNLSEIFGHQKDVWTEFKTERILKDFECKYKEVYRDIIEQIFLNINQKPFYESLQYMKSVNDFGDILKSRHVYESLLLISKLRNEDLIKHKHVFINNEYEKWLSRLLCTIYEKLKDIEMGETLVIEDFYPDNTANLNKRLVSILKYFLVIIHKLASNSTELNFYLGSSDMITVMIRFLKNKALIDKFGKINEGIIGLFVTNLACFSVYSIENKRIWQNLNSIEILFKTVEKFEKNSTILKQSFNCIGFIMSESQIETYFDKMFEFSKKLLDDLDKVSHAFKNYKNFKKYKIIKKINIEILNEQKEINKYEVSMIYGNLLTNTLNILINFSLNFKMKKIIFKHLESIKMIILKGYFIERVYSLKLLAQLCFDDEICASLLLNEMKFIEYLRGLLRNTSSNNELIRCTCENILISLDNSINSNESNEENNDNEIKKSIMISFYRLDLKNQRVFTEIKNELEKYDYKILNDENTSLVNMSKNIKLIEQSNHVLIFLCEKYRLNENCQLEAKHAFKMKKRIIPLVIQNNFDIMDGWLQIILNDKKMLSLQNSLPNIVENVKMELENIVNKSDQVNFADFRQDKNIQIKLWNSDQVKSWLISNNFNSYIIDAFSHLDGILLEQFYLKKCNKPQYFLKLLASDTQNKLKLAELAEFMAKLDILFLNTGMPNK